MIKVIREVTTKPTGSTEADSHVPEQTLLIIAVTTDSKHYDLFERLVESLEVEIEEKVKHG